MKELNRVTKLEPTDIVKNYNYFINLFRDPLKDKDKNKLSSKEKSEVYGIDIRPFEKQFTGYIIEETKFIDGNNKLINPNSRIFPILDKIEMTKWLCFYEKKNYNEAKKFYNVLSKASIAYGVKIGEPEWIEITSNSPKIWIDKAEIYFSKNKNDYSFIIFLINGNDLLYKQLKQHSLYKIGYVSQVINIKTLKRNGILSICSKILLQINSKLGGILYKIQFDKNIMERKLMIIGIHYSHYKCRKGIAMVATINDSFTEFFNKEEIFNEKNKKNKKTLLLPINSFIDEAIEVYKKENKEIPKNIIIYRQGVSSTEKNFLKEEIKQIDLVCKIKNIKYFYILVNKKVNFKFFENSDFKFSYFNPNQNLLVLDGITNKNYFEFYLQPQEVLQGSGNPICYHVAYGDLDIPDLIPKLTFDLCNLYCNWQGKVRIPNVMKAAEKLSKITAKYMPEGIDSQLRLGQIYL